MVATIKFATIMSDVEGWILAHAANLETDANPSAA